MAGAGYDIGASAAQATNMTSALTAFTNIAFRGGTISGSGSTTAQRDTADATATSKSPGAVSEFKDTGSLGLPGLPGTSNTPQDNRTLWLAVAGLTALFLLTKH